ncbi:glutamate rich 3-like isoform X1 [Strix aluco]|uniref:glutamate rich 3-like isoform X1 n=1 Tax=Strix aluco TaxID=111821 RepID=UPI003DA28F2A
MSHQEERSEVKGPKAVEYVTSISPIINTGLTPAPPPPQQRGGNPVRGGVTRGRQLRPITVPTDTEQPPRKNSGVVFRPPVRSGACVTMAFVGKNLRLSGKDADGRSEIRVYQQHCGGENLCVYKGSLLEGGDQWPSERQDPPTALQPRQGLRSRGAAHTRGNSRHSHSFWCILKLNRAENTQLDTPQTKYFFIVLCVYPVQN